MREELTGGTADRDVKFLVPRGRQGVRMGCTLAVRSVARMIRAAVGGDGALDKLVTRPT